MNRRIEVPIWLIAISVSLNVLLIVGTVIGMITGNGVSLIKPTSTPTATATATATVAPTKAPTPTASPTRPPTKCAGGGIEGIDCPVTVFNLSVQVVGAEHPDTYTENGTEYRPEEGYEFLLVHLSLPSETVKDEVVGWIVEDGGVHAPVLVGRDGGVVVYASAYADPAYEDEFRVVFVFVVEKGSDPDLIFPDAGITVNLSLVPDLTPASSPQSGATEGQASEPTEVPVPTATDVSEVP